MKLLKILNGFDGQCVYDVNYIFKTTVKNVNIIPVLDHNLEYFFRNMVLIRSDSTLKGFD